MSDYTAVPYEAREATGQLASTWAEDARAFARGLVVTAAIAALGTIAVVAVLMVGVVGAPVIAAAIAYVVLRERRAARASAATGWRPAES